MKRLFSFIIVFCMIISIFIGDTHSLENAASFTDIDSHWAYNAIEKWSGRGILKGTDGLFRPNDPITRAELAAVINRVVGYETVSDTAFKDVDADAWYFDDIMKLNAAGVMQGSEGYARPNDNITREEAAVMFARAFGITNGAGTNEPFDDASEISDWARAYIESMSAMGYIRGTNNRFRPRDYITRAETVVLLDNINPELNNTTETPAPTPEPTPPPTPAPAPTPEVPEQEPDGSKNNPFIIASEDDMKKFASDMKRIYDEREGKDTTLRTVEPQPGRGQYYVLKNDIAVSDWIPVIDYFGHFDGGGHTITINSLKCEKGLYGNYYDLGLFHQISSTATLENLNMKAELSISFPAEYNSYFDNYGNFQSTVSGNMTIGGIAATNLGTINNCTFTGSISVICKRSPQSGTPPTDETRINAGGIVGMNAGRINNCYFSGNVQVTDSRISSVGGIAGDNGGRIGNCYFMGSIANYCDIGNAGGIAGSMNTIFLSGLSSLSSNSFIVNCYATGSVLSGSGNCGGIVGSVNASSHSSDIQKCVALNVSVSGNEGRTGRISGVDGVSSIFLDNYAIDTMTTSHTPISKKNGRDGETISVSSLRKTFFSNTLKWPFADDASGGSSDKPWVWNDGYALPMLWYQASIPAAMPEHLLN